MHEDEKNLNKELIKEKRIKTCIESSFFILLVAILYFLLIQSSYYTSEDLIILSVFSALIIVPTLWLSFRKKDSTLNQWINKNFNQALKLQLILVFTASFIGLLWWSSSMNFFPDYSHYFFSAYFLLVLSILAYWTASKLNIRKLKSVLDNNRVIEKRKIVSSDNSYVTKYNRDELIEEFAADFGKKAKKYREDEIADYLKEKYKRSGHGSKTNAKIAAQQKHPRLKGIAFGTFKNWEIQFKEFHSERSIKPVKNELE